MMDGSGKGFDLKGFYLNLSTVRLGDAHFFQHSQPPDALAGIAGDPSRVPHIESSLEKPVGKLFQVGQRKLLPVLHVE